MKYKYSEIVSFHMPLKSKPRIIHTKPSKGAVSNTYSVSILPGSSFVGDDLPVKRWQNENILPLFHFFIYKKINSSFHNYSYQYVLVYSINQSNLTYLKLLFFLSYFKWLSYLDFTVMRMTVTGFHLWSPDAALSGRPARWHWHGAYRSRALQWSVCLCTHPVQSTLQQLPCSHLKPNSKGEKKRTAGFYFICSIESS